MRQQTLRGVRVLDFSAFLAGPYGATLLGDLGADVVKVEPPGGDLMRKYPTTLEGENRYHLGVNRNKRSVVIDLKTEEGRAVCHDLVRRCDVVIHNFRPGVPGRLALDFATLSGVNPRIVYCSLTGYGSTGPLAQRPGFDQVLQCFSGIAAKQGASLSEPQVVFGSVVDFYAASIVAMAVSAALFDRERTGQPQLVETSLLRASITMQAGRLVWADDEPADIERDLRPGRLAGIHPTKSGHIYLQAQSPEFWQALCELTGLSHLADDERFDTMPKRKANETELLALLHRALVTRTAVEWELIFGARVPCAVVTPFESLFEHPQVLEQRMLHKDTHPRVGAYRTLSGAVEINHGRESLPPMRAPMVGEHTVEVLREAGYGDCDIDLLVSMGAVAQLSTFED